MWLVRLSSILTLATALMLPPGLFRDCCCANQSRIQRASHPKLPPCCQAKADAKRKATQVRSGSNVADSSFRLERLPCRCQPPLAASAIALSDQRVTKSIEPSSYCPLMRTEADCRFPLLTLTDGSSLQRRQTLDPPLRKTLCRWII